ncbi:DUF1705 domain-containing protein [Pseudoxanthomonas sp. NC8]|nr:DUF1705 domain-containing protein [Pseudoxanthomonas sp. NC8]
MGGGGIITGSTVGTGSVVNYTITPREVADGGGSAAAIDWRCWALAKRPTSRAPAAAAPDRSCSVDLETPALAGVSFYWGVCFFGGLLREVSRSTRSGMAPMAMLLALQLAPTLQVLWINQRGLSAAELGVLAGASLLGLALQACLYPLFCRAALVLAALIAALGILELGFVAGFGWPFDANALHVVAETNVAEAADLVGALPHAWLAAALVIPAGLAWIGLRAPAAPIARSTRAAAARISLLLVAGLLGLAAWTGCTPARTAVSRGWRSVTTRLASNSLCAAHFPPACRGSWATSSARAWTSPRRGNASPTTGSVSRSRERPRPGGSTCSWWARPRVATTWA